MEDDSVFSTRDLTKIVTSIQQEMQDYRELIARREAQESRYNNLLDEYRNRFKSSIAKKEKRIKEYQQKLTLLEKEIDKLHKKTAKCVTKIENLK